MEKLTVMFIMEFSPSLFITFSLLHFESTSSYEWVSDSILF